MWGGKVSLPRRERFRTAKTTEIAAIAGQKILFSQRGSMRLCSECGAVGKTRSIMATLLKRKRMPKSGRLRSCQSIGVEDLARPNSKECIEALDILALYWCPTFPLAPKTLGQSCRSIPGST